MLRLAAAAGTRVLCATPHSHGPDLDVPRERAVAAHAALVAAAREANIDVEVRLGAENWYRPDLPALAREGRLATYVAGGKRWALVEFPPTHVPAEAAETFFALRLEGIHPVVAHPERNPSFWAKPAAAAALREQGALLQVTAGSLTGLFRKESRECAKALFKLGAVDLLASDAHRRDRRPPGLADACAVAAKWGGAKAPERLTEAVPDAILKGTDPR